MRVKRDGRVVTIDLHGLYEKDAKNMLLRWLDNVPQGVDELRIIHGWNQGTVLKDMVQKDISVHKSVSAVLRTLNSGETRVILK